jgi:HEAT repeat protein
LQSATNAGTRREVLQQLDGVTKASLKTPLLGLLGRESDNEVREELIDNLRHFVGDSDVESALWKTMLNDPDEDVREEAEEALQEGPVTPARLTALRERALDTKAPLDERLVALRALHNAEAPAPEVISTLASLAQTTKDPIERAKLFEAFDDANDPAFVAPLVQGLQDPNSVVRQEAVDALGDYASGDPNVRQWLEYIAANDPDPRVQREAFSTLRGLRR